MQQDVLLHLGVICADLLSSSSAFLLSTLMENSANASSRAFLLSSPMENMKFSFSMGLDIKKF